jgi:hypothetical protein
MPSFTCKGCNSILASKFSLERHINADTYIKCKDSYTFDENNRPIIEKLLINKIVNNVNNVNINIINENINIQDVASKYKLRTLAKLFKFPNTSTIDITDIKKVLAKDDDKSFFEKYVSIMYFDPLKPCNINVVCISERERKCVIFDGNEWIKKSLIDVINHLCHHVIKTFNYIINEYPMNKNNKDELKQYIKTYEDYWATNGRYSKKLVNDIKYTLINESPRFSKKRIEETIKKAFENENIDKEDAIKEDIISDYISSETETETEIPKLKPKTKLKAKPKKKVAETSSESDSE